MFVRRTAAIVIAMVVLSAGCQSAGVSPGPTIAPTEPATGVGGEPSPPEGGSTIDPDWITRPALTCGDEGRLFPPEALEGPGLAELGLDSAAAVLRSTIAETPDTQFPASG